MEGLEGEWDGGGVRGEVGAMNHRAKLEEAGM